MSLRTRAMLVVLGGAVGPLALVGLWLASGFASSAERYMRNRLDGALTRTVGTISERYPAVRSRLLDLAGDPRTLAVMAGKGSQPGTAALNAFEMRVQQDSDLVGGIAVVDAEGRRVTSVQALRSTPSGPYIDVQVPVFDDAGRTLGRLTASIPLREILPPDALSPVAAPGTLIVLDADGHVLTPGVLDPTALAPRFRLDGESWVSVRRRLYDPPMQLAMAAPMGAVLGPFSQAARRGVVALLLVLLLVVPLTLLAADRLTRPLQELEETATRWSVGDLDSPVQPRGPTEVRRLAVAFDRMRSSLKRLISELSQKEALAAVGEYAAGIAHEVRNPLMAARLDLERIRRHTDARAPLLDAVDAAVAQLDRIEETVSSTLRIARAGAPSRAPISVDEPLDRAAGYVTPNVARIGGDLEVRGATGLRVVADPAALEQLFENVLRNAAEASPPGGRVTVDVAVEASRVRIDVRDEGPGFSDEQRKRAFDPLFTTKQGGTGLGLSLAQRIAHAHGGNVELPPGSPGGHVRIALPRANESDAA